MKQLVLGLVAVCAAVSSFAQTVYVDGRNGNDDWDGSCAYADRDEAAKKGPLKTFSKFKNKFNKSDGITVSVAPGVYNSPQPFSYWGTTWASATIIGTGTADDPVIFDGGSQKASMQVNQSYRILRLENLVFRNGLAESGGGAMATTTAVRFLSISNCVFESCSITKSGSVGGALALNQAMGTEIVGCSFANCTATGHGGAVYVANTTQDVKVVNSSFTGCSSGDVGGAVYVAFADGEITKVGLVAENCAFTNNTANFGGAIGSPTRLCKGTTFVGNSARTRGGAWFYSGYTGKHGTSWLMTNAFVSCTFENNTAPKGGVFCWDYTKRFAFRDCTFVGNVSEGKGAVWECETTTFDFLVENCLVERNRGEGVFNVAPLAVSGTSPWGVRFINSVFADNDAGEADVLTLSKSTMRMEKCSFLRNIGKWTFEAGGSTGNTNYLANCLFACNTNRCSGSQGLIYIEWQGISRTSCYNVTFVSNAAPAAPYVIYSNLQYGMKVFANVVTFGNRGLDGETGDPYTSGIRNAIRYSFFETGTASVPADVGNVVADDPKFIAGTYRPALGSPIGRKGQFYDWMSDATDLDGAPRLNDNGTVAMGCYRYELPGLLLFIR